MNPYTNLTFIEVIGTFIQRMVLFFLGLLPGEKLATDEIQIFVLMAVSASCSLVGCYLILRKMTMLANALSHTILIGIVVAFIVVPWSVFGSSGFDMTTMLFASLVAGLLTTFLTQFLHTVMKLQEDASTGLVFTTLFAIGIVLVTALSRDAHIGIEVVMGNVDALHVDDLKLVYLILASNIFLCSFFFKEFQIIAFDRALAKSLGIAVLFFDYLFMIQVSATSVGAFRAVGVLMVLALITGPALTARLLTHSLKKMILLSIGIGCLASIIGVALSRHLLSIYGIALTTAGIVVCVIIVFYLAAIGYTLIKQWEYRRRILRLH